MNLNENEIKVILASYDRINSRYIPSNSQKHYVAVFDSRQWISDSDYWAARNSLFMKGFINKKRKLTDKGMKVYKLYESFEEL